MRKQAAAHRGMSRHKGLARAGRRVALESARVGEKCSYQGEGIRGGLDSLHDPLLVIVVNETVDVQRVYLVLTHIKRRLAVQAVHRGRVEGGLRAS